MRLPVILLAVVLLAPVALADDAADVKQAYITYLQARLDRNLDAAKAASVGDELGQRFLAADIERQMLTGRLMAARAKLANTTQPAQPKMNAADTFKMMLDNADVTVEGETAVIKPKGAPKGYGFKKVDGKWKADLNNWENMPREEHLKMLETMLPAMREIAAKAENGEYKSPQELETAMRAAEQKARGDAGPSTRPH